MSKRLEITGIQSGRLTVMSFHEVRKQSTWWNCYCNPEYGGCGKKDVLVDGSNLVSGNTKSCGCIYKDTSGRKDRTGEVTGYLRVINYSHTEGKIAFWNCHCDPRLGGCGKSHKVRSGSRSRSCGCGKYFNNIAGQPFGRLTAIEKAGRTRLGAVLWRCICECGNETTVDNHSLLRPKNPTKSCGCLRTETSRSCENKKSKHGRRSKVGKGRVHDTMYALWQYIKLKCYAVNHPNYTPGFTVCPEWKSDFKTFLNDMGERPKRKTFLLKEGCTEYNKENCYWGSYSEIRRRHEHPMTLHGVTKTMTAWSRELGIPLDVLYNRCRNLWSDQRALTQPVREGTRGYGTYLLGSDNIVHSIRRIKHEQTNN